MTTPHNHGQHPSSPGDNGGTPASAGTGDRQPGDEAGAGERLAQLRTLVVKARAMPMSASCVLNRAEALALIDAIGTSLPAELDRAKGLLGHSHEEITRAEAEGNRIIESARDQAAELARHTSVMEQAEEQAAKIRADAEQEAADLRRETNAYIDERMANFESVLHKSVSQVRTYRQRLAEHAGPDELPD